MIISTRRFGDIKIDPAKIITFQDGMIGFGRYSRYAVLPFMEGTPFELLQSIDERDLAFVVIDPFIVNPDYRFEVSDEDLAALQVKDGKELVIRVVVTLPADLKQMTANLQGPVLLNEKRLLGKQIVLINTDFSVKHPVLPADANP
jgi:flagellar assembly factor FliW